jgi:Carboxypeptidase regulatory-like domain
VTLPEPSGSAYALALRMLRYFLATVVLLAAVGCHPGQPVIGGEKMQVGGTISGIVSATGGSVALPSRKVTAINTATGSKYEAITAANGGYTIKVPEGSYRVEVELRTGETLEKKPDEVRIRSGDLDAGRDFVVTVK